MTLFYRDEKKPNPKSIQKLFPLNIELFDKVCHSYAFFLMLKIRIFFFVFIFTVFVNNCSNVNMSKLVIDASVIVLQHNGSKPSTNR